MKTPAIILLALVILAGTPGAFAFPDYLTDLSAVYGDGSCGTCHVMSSGGGPLTPYGRSFENQVKYEENASAALIAIGPPSAVIATATPSTGGFGFILSLAGLFSWALLTRWNEK